MDETPERPLTPVSKTALNDVSSAHRAERSLESVWKGARAKVGWHYGALGCAVFATGCVLLFWGSSAPWMVGIGCVLVVVGAWWVGVVARWFNDAAPARDEHYLGYDPAGPFLQWTPMVVDMVPTANPQGSAPSPPFESGWSEIARLRWKAGVVLTETGHSVAVTTGGSTRDGAPIVCYGYSLPGRAGTVGDFEQMWSWLNGLRVGASLPVADTRPPKCGRLTQSWRNGKPRACTMRAGHEDNLTEWWGGEHCDPEWPHK